MPLADTILYSPVLGAILPDVNLLIIFSSFCPSVAASATIGVYCYFVEFSGKYANMRRYTVSIFAGVSACADKYP